MAPMECPRCVAERRGRSVRVAVRIAATIALAAFVVFALAIQIEARGLWMRDGSIRSRCCPLCSRAPRWNSAPSFAAWHCAPPRRSPRRPLTRSLTTARVGRWSARATRSRGRGKGTLGRCQRSPGAALSRCRCARRRVLQGYRFNPSR